MATDPIQKSSSKAASTTRPAWLGIAMLIAILGIVLSVYSTWHHIEVHANGSTDAVCNINATVNCDAVAMSSYSEVAGVPLGVFGLGFFVASLVLLAVAWSGGKTAKEHLHAYVAMSVIGVLVSLVLGGISVGILHHYCLVCFGIYLTTILQLGVVLIGRKTIPSGFSFKELVSGGSTAAIAVAVIVAAYSFLKPAGNATATAPNGVASSSSQPLGALAPTHFDIPLSKSPYSGLGEDYRQGGDNAKVVIEEFADFECPACGHMSHTLDEIHKEYGDRVLISFRNYPLDNSCNDAIHGKMHEFACDEAVMARCAGQYGKFWPYYHLAYDQQASVSKENVVAWAKQIGLTQDQIDACKTNKDLMVKVQDDIKLGNKFGIDATPTLYINGRKLEGGHGLNDIRAAIEQAMQE